MAEKLNGYKHLFLIPDFWNKVFRTPFYNWYSKKWNSDLSEKLRTLWGVSPKHLQREQGYKGNNQETSNIVLRIPSAGVTSAGLMMILGVLGQNRGLAQMCQAEALNVLGRVCACITVKAFSLAILPDWVIEVKDLFVQMHEFWEPHLPQMVKGLRQRYLGFALC